MPLVCNEAIAFWGGFDEEMEGERPFLPEHPTEKKSIVHPLSVPACKKVQDGVSNLA